MIYSSRARSRSPRRARPRSPRRARPRSRQGNRTRSKVNIKKVLAKRRTKTQRDVNQVLKLFLWVVHTFRGAIRRFSKTLARPINFGAGLAYVILDCLLLGAFFMVGAISYLMTIIITKLNPETASVLNKSVSSLSQAEKRGKRGKRGKNTKTKKQGSAATDEPPPEGPMWYVSTFYKVVQDRVKRGTGGEIAEASASLSGDLHFKGHKNDNLSVRQGSHAQDDETSSEEDSQPKRRPSVRGQGSAYLGEEGVIRRMSARVSKIMDDVTGVMQTFDKEEAERNDSSE